MGRFIALFLLLAVAFWLGREFAQARRRRMFLATRDGRGQPMLPPHRRASEEAIGEQAAVLRAAVKRGDISLDEAAGSLVRFAGAGMSAEEARRRVGG